MKQNQFIKTILPLTITGALCVGLYGYETASEKLNPSQGLLYENIEALSQGAGDVPNGTVLKIDPMYTKTCYSSRVDMNDYHIERGYDEENNEVYEYKKYKHYYSTYKSYTCKSYPIETAPAWFENCSVPSTAKCNQGDYDSKPNPSVYYE